MCSSDLGVQTNFRMPDVISVALGGGSVVHADGTFGPESVGARIGEEALVFGGAVATLTDAAVAAGDQGYGAVIVKEGRIVGEAPSRVVVNGDPTAHAEMEAIRDAARRLGTRDLSGMAMYGSSRACPMCRAAAYWAGIGQLYSGAGPTDDGRPGL